MSDRPPTESHALPFEVSEKTYAPAVGTETVAVAVAEGDGADSNDPVPSIAFTIDGVNRLARRDCDAVRGRPDASGTVRRRDRWRGARRAPAGREEHLRCAARRSQRIALERRGVEQGRPRARSRRPPSSPHSTPHRRRSQRSTPATCGRARQDVPPVLQQHHRPLSATSSATAACLAFVTTGASTWPTIGRWIIP